MLNVLLILLELIQNDHLKNSLSIFFLYLFFPL